jgi:hypothetical protein
MNKQTSEEEEEDKTLTASKAGGVILSRNWTNSIQDSTIVLLFQLFIYLFIYFMFGGCSSYT